MNQKTLLLLVCALVCIAPNAAHRHKHKHRKPSSSEEVAALNDDHVDEDFYKELEDENENEEFCAWQKCENTLSEATGFSKYVDLQFLRKVVRNLNPFSKQRPPMRFFLFRRQFPECGHEMRVNDESLVTAGIDASVPTRIIIHGWMSQSRGSFNRDVRNAYLQRGDFNVIVADWSASASNINYFSVVKMIDEFGQQVAEFTQQLHSQLGVQYDDIYLIGHSLGAQIAGAAGKHIKPAQYNTIFALDPAGPRFRRRSDEFRIDPTDARYVESIQTSANLGFLEPRGNATFYPNYGIIQEKCYFVGCSHVRSYKMFTESINSLAGFWGKLCKRHKKNWDCEETEEQSYRMGGEPATVKTGTFYVKTAGKEPFALGPNT